MVHVSAGQVGPAGTTTATTTATTSATTVTTSAPAPARAAAAGTGGPRPKTLRADGVWEGRQRTRLSVRGFTFATGEPERVGGDDSAPTPMEVVLAAFEGCLAVVVETVAAERGVALRSLELSAEAEMDTRGFAGVPGVRPYFTWVRARVAVDAGTDAAGLAPLRDQVHRRGPAPTHLQAADLGAPVTWGGAA